MGTKDFTNTSMNGVYFKPIPWDLADELHKIGMEMQPVPIGAHWLEEDEELKQMLARNWCRPCYAQAFDFLSQILKIFVTVGIDENISIQLHRRVYYIKVVKINCFGKKDAGTTISGFVLYGEAMQIGLEEAIKIANGEV